MGHSPRGRKESDTTERLGNNKGTSRPFCPGLPCTMKRPCYHFAWVDSPTSGVHWDPDSHFPPCSPASVSWQSSGSSGVYQLPTESSCKFPPVRLAGRAESHWEAWFEP